jgi:hypothetical protein
LPKSRSRNCGHIALPPNSGVDQEKGPLTLRERPKSREETPKEGDGSGRDSLATALQQHTLRRTKFKAAGRGGRGFSPYNLLSILLIFTAK